MRSLLIAFVMLASVAAAARPLNLAALLLAQAPASRPSQANSDEDDEEEGSEGVSSPTPDRGSTPPSAEGAVSSPVTGDPAAQSARQLTPEQRSRQQQLVSGAPLYNPNVAVHIVEKKQFSDSSKSELALYPVASQINGKFVQHHGVALSYTYHVNENFGLQLTPQYNWYNREAAFNQELVDSVSRLPQAASSLLLQWASTAGVEVSPFYGKFAFYEGKLAHFSFVINGGAGVGQTRTQIRAESVSNGITTPPSFGDAGLRFVGSVGAGFRVQFGDRFAFRMEVRDVVYSAQVNAINGCNQADLSELQRFASTTNRPLGEASVRGGCRVQNFEGVKEGTNYDRRRDIPLALDSVSSPSSDVLNNIGFYTGFSFLF